MIKNNNNKPYMDTSLIKKDNDVSQNTSSEDIPVREQKIHDVKHNKTYYAQHYFPPPNKSSQYKNILFTLEGISFMTTRIDAEIISGLIIKYCSMKDVNYNDITLTDATAGLGGNTMSFAKLFRHINVIEKNPFTFEILSNNLKEYGYRNITIINDDYANIYNELTQNVIFIDPPWGGKKYLKQKKLRLQLSHIDIEQLCRNIRNNGEIIVMKLPINYDFEFLLNSLLELHVINQPVANENIQHILEQMNQVIAYDSITTHEQNDVDLIKKSTLERKYSYDLNNIHIHRLKKMYILIIL